MCFANIVSQSVAFLFLIVSFAEKFFLLLKTNMFFSFRNCVEYCIKNNYQSHSYMSFMLKNKRQCNLIL